LWIDVRQAESVVVVREHAHQRARLELRQGGLLGIDLVAEDPKVARLQAPVFIAFQAQCGQLRNGIGIGH